MDISHLSQSASHQGVYSNGPAKIVGETPIDSNFRNKELPSAIYHGLDQSVLPETGGGAPTLYLASTETNEEASARLSGVVRLLSKDLGQASAGLEYSYNAAIEDLSPDLVEKDWGFSTTDGELTVTAGADNLSEQETDTIKAALQSTGVTDSADIVADTVVRAFELDRGPAGVSNGIGRYDVSKENFGDVVDLRAYLESHAPGGQYGQHRVDPSDVAIGRAHV